jgi:L-alanine-DL-glutamate epimerase-like enolase superfamily enzyme
MDANGRYDSLDRIKELLDYADKIGALEQVAVLEEPFPEGSGFDVSSLPVTVAADESAHSDKDAEELIGLGYKAIALKPIAKTMSMSFKTAAAAAKHGIPCFCADLTVGPLLVDFNKCFAARFAPGPGMKIGMLETNGGQNYREWKRLLSEHPVPDGSWIPVKDGVFNLDESFYALSGGMFTECKFHK